MLRRIALIPSYEPDEKIFPLIDELLENDFSVVVVDDGSGENYDNIYTKIPQSVVVLRYPINQGKGFALKHGLKYIEENYKEEYTIVTLDSDGQHKVKDAIRIVLESEENKDKLILGSRYFDKSCPKKSRMGNFFARTAFTLFTRKKIYDTQTGLRAWNSSLTSVLIDSKGNRYEYEMNVLLDCTRHRIPIKEVTIATIYIDGNAGTHYNPLKDTVRIFKEIIKFSASSGIGFLVDYGMFNLLHYAMKLTVIPSNIIARVVSATVNFVINYFFVFKAKEKLYKSAIKYALLAVFILAVNTGILWVFTNKLGIPEYLAKLLVEITMFFVSWLIQRLFVFKKGKKKNEK